MIPKLVLKIGSRVLGGKSMLAAAGTIAIAAGMAGWTLRDWKCDAAFHAAESARKQALIEALQEQVEQLAGRVALRDEALRLHTERALKAQAERDEQQEVHREIQQAAGDGDCLDVDTVERLRRLWRR